MSQEITCPQALYSLVGKLDFDLCYDRSKGVNGRQGEALKPFLGWDKRAGYTVLVVVNEGLNG